MSVLANILNSQRKINFDFSKSLNENLGEISQSLITANTPVKPNQTAWQEVDGYLCCYFYFNSMSHVAYFLNLVLEKANKINHTPDIVIKDLNVSISLQTKDIHQITEIDLDFAEFITEVYDDIKFIRDF